MALTSIQINTKIMELIGEKNNLNNELDKYKDSLSYCNKLIINLKNSNKQLNSAMDYMKMYFTINGKTADEGKTSIIKYKIDEIMKSLNNNIIPEINNKINNLNNKIKNIDKELNNLKKQLDSVGF